MSRKLEIELELKIAHKAIEGLLAAGYGVGVYDGEEETVKDSKDAEAIKKALFTTDEDYLIAYKDGTKAGWVWLIYGNVQDVISDYTVNLEDALAETIKFAQSYD